MGRGGWESKDAAEQTTSTSGCWNSILPQCRQAVELLHDLYNVVKESDNEERRMCSSVQDEPLRACPFDPANPDVS